MNVKKLSLILILGTAIHATTAQAQLYRVALRAKCVPPATDVNGRSRTSMTERDLIAECVGSGFSNSQLAHDFALVYNAAADSIQVVSTTDGSSLCDVFLFQGGTNVISDNRLTRLVFVFPPNDTNAIGSAVINERQVSNGSGNRAGITGNIQFIMTGSLSNSPSSSNTSLTVPTGGATNGIGNVDANGLGNASGNTNSGVASTTTTGLAATGFVENTAANNLAAAGVEICVGTFTANRLLNINGVSGGSTTTTTTPVTTNPGTGVGTTTTNTVPGTTTGTTNTVGTTTGTSGSGG